jgi:hypothetical protein
VKVGQQYRKGSGSVVWTVQYLERDTWGGAPFASLVAPSGKTRKVYTSNEREWTRVG